MKILFLAFLTCLFFTACNNNGKTSKTFCDTTCKTDSFLFKSEDKFGASVNISVKNCIPDTIAWTHDQLATSTLLPMHDLTGQEVRLNTSAISCIFKDTSYAWLTFNDCITGRGYLFKLPFNKNGAISKITGAINNFDPKFHVQENLRAYTDRGSIFVININSGKEAQMTFKEAYDIDFNKIHEAIDSVNITPKRIYVRLLKQGKEISLEKVIDL